MDDVNCVAFKLTMTDAGPLEGNSRVVPWNSCASACVERTNLEAVPDVLCGRTSPIFVVVLSTFESMLCNLRSVVEGCKVTTSASSKAGSAADTFSHCDRCCSLCNVDGAAGFQGRPRLRHACSLDVVVAAGDCRTLSGCPAGNARSTLERCHHGSQLFRESRDQCYLRHDMNCFASKLTITDTGPLEGNSALAAILALES